MLSLARFEANANDEGIVFGAMKNLVRFFALCLPLVGFSFPTSSLLNAQMVTPASASVNFGSINVCTAGKTTPLPCSATQTVTFNISAGTTVGSIAIVTTGIPDLDFNPKASDTSTTLCKAQTYSSATTCTVNVTFAPLAPGTRNGAVELLDGNSVLAMTYIYGIGVGPQIAFSPAVQVPLGNGTIGCCYLAVDDGGNIFINGTEELLAASDYTTVKTINVDSSGGTGGNPYVQGIAMDGAGNLFLLVSYNFGNTIEEILAAGGYTILKTLAISTSSQWGGITVDPAGNIFVTVYPAQTVEEILAAGGYTTTKTLASGFNEPFGIAIDSEGNLFVSDVGGAKDINEILAAGGYTTVKLLTNGTQYTSLVAVDATGNLFTITYHGDITMVSEILAAGGYTTSNTLAVGTAAHELFLLAVDGGGNVYVTSTSSPYLSELVRSQPAAFAFDTALVGTTSSDSPQSATVQNVGNASLTFSGLSFTDAADFALVAGSGEPQDCTDGLSLAPGVECNLSIDFTPQSPGALTGSLVVADDSGNASGATQSIGLSGTGTTVQVSPAILQFGSVPYPGGSATLPLTITNIGTGTLTIDPSSNGRGAVITGNTCGAGVGAGKSCTLQVEFDPVHLGPNTNTLTIATNAATSPKIPVRGTATGVGSLTTFLDLAVTGRGSTEYTDVVVTNYGVPGKVTVATETGATAFSVYSNPCTAGITAGNSCTIGVKFAPVQQGTETGYLKLIPSVGPEQIIVVQGTLTP